MAYSKQHLYNEKVRLTSLFAKALSHSARITLLLQLHLEGPTTAGKLAKMHPISIQAISQHLRILRKADLVIAWEKYPYTFYKINNKTFKKMKGILKVFLDNF